MRSRLATCVGIGLGTLWSVACGGSTDSAVVVTAKDSAGIRVVQSSIESGRAPVFMEVGPADLVIGAVDGDPVYTFGSVTEVRALPDGGIAGTDLQDLTLRVYDRTGVHRWTVGGRGGGPGEFRMMLIAGVGLDGIRTWDPINQRLTHFSPVGDFVEAMTFQREAAGPLFEVRRLADATYLARSRFRKLDPLSPEYSVLKVTFDSLVLRHLDSRGVDLDTIVVAPAEEFMREVWAGAGGTPRPVGGVRPFGAQTFWISQDDGSSTTLRSTTLELVTRDRYGAVHLIARLLRPPLALNPSDVQRLKARGLEEMRNNGEFRAFIERVFDEAHLPALAPLVSALKVDARGNYWVGEFAVFPEEVTEWLVFSPTGELLGGVSLPPRFIAHDIGDGYVLGVWSDEFDVQYIRRYPLLPPKGE